MLSDCHLGVYETDAILREDSFDAFDEAIHLLNNCDLILLPGDLFDQATPSNPVKRQCIEILRTSSDVEPNDDVQINSVEGSSNLRVGTLNRLPILVTHGHHDFPIGFPQPTSILSVLSRAGLIEYIDSNPRNKLACKRIIFEKNGMQLQVEAFGHVNEALLGEQYSPEIFKPEKGVFNIAIFHESLENYVPGKIGMIRLAELPDVDLAIFGHRHKPEMSGGSLAVREVREKKVKIALPGSITPTSLSESDSGKRYVHILDIGKEDVSIHSLPLVNARLTLYDKIDIPNATPTNFEQPCRRKLLQLLSEEYNKQPRVRLVIQGIIAEGFSIEDFNALRLLDSLRDKILNPEDAIKVELKPKKQIQLEERLRTALTIGLSDDSKSVFLEDLSKAGYKGILLTKEELFDEASIYTEEKFCELIEDKVSKKLEEER